MGTQGTKALVYEASTGEVLGRASISYGLISKRPGQAEQLPSTWLEVRGWVDGWMASMGSCRPSTAASQAPLECCCQATSHLQLRPFLLVPIAPLQACKDSSSPPWALPLGCCRPTSLLLATAVPVPGHPPTL